MVSKINKRWDSQVKIKSNTHMCLSFYELIIESKDMASVALPGQFCMVSVPNAYLRRPLSIYKTTKTTVSFLYKIIGKGTEVLSTLRPGETVKVLGPLGTSYPVNQKSVDGEPILVAGGTGIASVHFLASKLKKKGILFYGARTKQELLCLSEFEKIGWKVCVATEDGSKGFKGFVTDLLKEKIKNNNIVYTCGPTPMMKKVISIVKELKLNGYASLEEKMACGIGNCQGCAVKVGDEYKMVCKDGPVFSIELL
ncbi:dihydroorotate dehydrogenase electron transfer subunit [Elusimicrobiota bacterium]